MKKSFYGYGYELKAKADYWVENNFIEIDSYTDFVENYESNQYYCLIKDDRWLDWFESYDEETL